MSKVTHGNCSYRDTKMEERSFEATSVGATANHCTVHT